MADLERQEDKALRDEIASAFLFTPRRTTVNEQIEIAIARHGPDLAKTCDAAGASPRQVWEVIEELERIERARRKEHDCARHPQGSLACHDEHNCHCPGCLRAAKMRAACFEANDARSVALRAHSEYVTRSRRGQRMAQMPQWVIDGEREYQAGRVRREGVLGAFDRAVHVRPRAS